jgi:putative ABC transport system ATP-binding protein
VTGGAEIVLDEVGRDYPTTAGRSVRALEQVSMRLEAGSTVAVTGPSGCGKSTLLGLIAGLEAPSGGRIWIDDAEISALPDSERARIRRDWIGLVFQSDDLLPFLTALENVALQAALAGSQDERGAELLAELGLAEHAHKLPDQMSGGQRQRVAIAAAVVNRPRVILADEPTGSLDADGSEAVVDFLLQARRASGATLVIVTHDQATAGRMERQIRLRDGRLLEARGSGTHEGAHV